jgi:quercetin dioxygenase-like cupin family protein
VSDAVPVSDPVLYRPGEGERLAGGPGIELLLKATGDQTGGTLFMSETTIPPGFAGPVPHRHEQLHDMFYVLEGTLTVRSGDELHDCGPGTFACFPPGVVHTFSNRSDAPVRFLNFHTPAGFENYMRELAAAAQEGPLTPETMRRVASRYDFEPA